MRILLVCPPVADLTVPYLSLPALTAFLRERGLQVAQWDLNLEAVCELLRPESCSAYRDLVRARHGELDARSSLMFSEAREDLFLSRILPFTDLIVDNIGLAVDVIGGRRPQDALITRARAIQLIEQAFHLVSAAHYPESLKGTLREPNYETRFSRYSSRDCIAALGMRDSMFDSVYQKLVAPRIQLEEPDLVGISVTYPDQFIPAMKLATWVRDARPDVHICVGGAFLSVTNSRQIRNPALFDYVDSFVLDTGEEPLLGLARHLNGEGTELQSISGLIYRDGGEIRHNRTEIPEDFASLPAPDYSGLDLGRYFTHQEGMELSLILAYGCYWRRCAFCEHLASLRRHTKTAACGRNRR